MCSKFITFMSAQKESIQIRITFQKKVLPFKYL